jgi:acyl-CoA dehydrogenase
MREFTQEQTMFREAYRRFIEAEVAPHMDKWRRQGIIDREVFKKAGDMGFLMIWPDEQYGGAGDNDFRYEQIIMEENARAETLEWFCTLHSRLIGPYIDKLGTQEQKKRWLPDCVAGNKILAIAMTEPDAGSDLSGMRSTLVEQEDGFILNGSKTYISNGINADLIIVAAKTDPNNPHSVALCVVERGMEGFERGRNLEKMGMKAQDTAELFFDNVKIPKNNILGDPSEGFIYLMQGLAEERLITAVMSAATSRYAFNLTREYVAERKVFGKPLSAKQNTQFKLAEMDAEIDMLQCFVDHCVYVHNKGQLCSTMAAKAKLQATEIEGRMMDLGVQLHGGAGYMMEYPICRLYTGCRISRILAGSSEIMKLIISRDIFSEKYSSILD